MAKKWYLLFVIIIFLTLLSACSANIEEEQKKAVEAAHSSFLEKKTAPNKELDAISLYLPFRMDIDDTNPYNLLLTKGNQSYILFINPNEEENSQVVYETTIQGADQIRINETFQEDDKFGFIIIQDIGDELYSLTVGRGGIKMTTETDAGAIAREAGTMMKIVSSVQFNKN